MSEIKPHYVLDKDGPRVVRAWNSNHIIGTLEEFAARDNGKSWIQSAGPDHSLIKYKIEGGELCIADLVVPAQLATIDYAGANRWFEEQDTGLSLLRQSLDRLSKSESLIDVALAQQIEAFLIKFTPKPYGQPTE